MARDVGYTGILMSGITPLATVLVTREYRHHYKVRITNLWAEGAKLYNFGDWLVVLKSDVALDGETDVQS